MTFLHDIKVAARSLAHSKGLTATVVFTLALGIGANAAIFSVVRGVLLRPLVNRDEDRLIYIRQSARGLGIENTTFSIPDIQDLRARVKTLSSFGTFSTIGFTMVGLGSRAKFGQAWSTDPISKLWDCILYSAGCSTRETTGRAPPGRCADLSFLDDGAQKRSVRARQNRPARYALGYHRGRAGTVGTLSGGNRNHSEHRDVARIICRRPW